MGIQMKTPQFLLFIVLTLFATSASAIRCNSRLALKGDSMYKFISVCGEPEFKRSSVVYETEKSSIKSRSHSSASSVKSRENRSSFDELIRLGAEYVESPKKEKRRGHDIVETSLEVERSIEVEEWFYNFGANRLVQKVTFIDGVAVKVESEGYGR